MTWMDKLEIGLKENAAYRKDNLPPGQVRGPEIPGGPGRSSEIPSARADHSSVPGEGESSSPPPDADRARSPFQKGTGSRRLSEAIPRPARGVAARLGVIMLLATAGLVVAYRLGVRHTTPRRR